MKTTTYSQIFSNGITAETAKAVKISFCVSWNSNCHTREFWFPKSVIKSIDGKIVEAADWFINKLEADNTFHGYMMSFECRF